MYNLLLCHLCRRIFLLTPGDSSPIPYINNHKQMHSRVCNYNGAGSNLHCGSTDGCPMHLLGILPMCSFRRARRCLSGSEMARADTVIAGFRSYRAHGEMGSGFWAFGYFDEQWTQEYEECVVVRKCTCVLPILGDPFAAAYSGLPGFVSNPPGEADCHLIAGRCSPKILELCSPSNTHNRPQTWRYFNTFKNQCPPKSVLQWLIHDSESWYPSNILTLEVLPLVPCAPSWPWDKPSTASWGGRPWSKPQKSPWDARRFLAWSKPRSLPVGSCFRTVLAFKSTLIIA